MFRLNPLAELAGARSAKSCPNPQFFKAIRGLKWTFFFFSADFQKVYLGCTNQCNPGKMENSNKIFFIGLFILYFQFHKEMLFRFIVYCPLGTCCSVLYNTEMFLYNITVYQSCRWAERTRLWTKAWLLCAVTPLILALLHLNALRSCLHVYIILKKHIFPLFAWLPSSLFGLST